MGARAVAVGLTLVALLNLAPLVTPNDEVDSWWSWIGIAAALLARLSPRVWLQTTLAATAIAAAAGVLVAVGLANGAIAVAAALVLTDLGRHRAQLRSLADLGRLTVAAAVAGTGGAVLTFAVDLRSDASLHPVWAVWLSYADSVLILGALGLTIDRITRTPPHRWAFITQHVALIASALLVFWGDQAAPVVLSSLPVLIWGALAFDIGWVTLQVALYCSFVAATTAYGNGPFAVGADRGLFDPGLLSTFVLATALSCALTVLPLSVTVGTRRDLMAKAGSDSRLLRRSFSESPLGMVFARDVDGVLVIDDANDAAARILGRDRGDLPGAAVTELAILTREDARRWQAVRDGVIETWHGQLAIRGRPDSVVEIAVAALDDPRRERYYSAQLLDVTAQHLADRRLQEAHELTDVTLDTAACVIVVLDADGTVIRVNAATERITGFLADDLLGRPIWDSLLPSLSRAEAEAMFTWPNRSGSPMVREQRTRTASGQPLLLMWTDNVVYDADGVVSYAVLTGIDVTAERSSSSLMTHLLEASITTAIVGIDLGGRITFANAGATHLLGFARHDLVGSLFLDLLAPSGAQQRSAPDPRHFFTDALAGRGELAEKDETRPQDWVWTTRSGGHLIVSTTLSRTSDDVREQVGFLVVGRDVTGQREAQRALVDALEKDRTALERLRALDHAKDEFVSTVSHELRTPVTSIVGYTEMLRDGTIGDPNDAQERMLASIARNGQRLIAICNDLLLLSGFESDTQVGHRERFDLRECVAAAADSVGALLAKRELSFSTNVEEDEVGVIGNRAQLDRVVINLLSNAVKFTSDGGSVTISLTATGGHALISVQDTGMGIPAEDREAVFQRFYRTERAQTLAIPGTGLGLSIVASIVEAHGGEIDLDSEVGEGSTFRVRLPLSS